MNICDYCNHVEMCGWRKELEEQGCEFFDDNSRLFDSIISQIEQARDKDKIAEYPYNRCIEILRRAVDEN